MNEQIHLNTLRRYRPLRQLLTLLAGAVIASAVLVSSATTDESSKLRSYSTGYVAAADTDSVAIRLDSLLFLRSRIDSLLFAGGNLDSLDKEGYRLDSLLANLRASMTLAADTIDTVLIRRYFPKFATDTRSSRVFPRDDKPFSPSFGRFWTHQIAFDTTALTYTSLETVGLEQVRFPVTLSFDEYKTARLKRDITETWSEILVSRARTTNAERRGGLGFEFTVPGGRQSAFTSIFGKPSFDLRVNGQADILAGFDYRKSDQQVAITGRSSQLDPNFKQDLRLGITGTIGDKLKVDVQYDSQNQFDYENQLSLNYTGYEDEIIQSIEAGNVFLPTKGALIRGGQSLFGIKSEFQVGAVHLTAVASQQEGQSNSLNIEGGSTSNPFDLRPTDYTDMGGFYLSYYFRNRWEEAHSDPPNIRVEPEFERITEIEVWRLQPTRPEELNVRQVVAMVDLGEESDEILNDAPDEYTDWVLPNYSNDHYLHESSEIDDNLRNGAASPASWLEEQKGMDPSDYQIGKFKRLDPGQDYSLDPVLGYITLNSRLQESEALAVAYRYRTNGQTIQIGDFSTETGGSDGGQSETKLVLKLLRPVQLRQPASDNSFNPAAWYLEMRNLYNLSSRGTLPTDFDLQIYYEPPGQTTSKTLPGLNSSKTLLQLLQWDRVNADGALLADDVFDFLVDYTIRPATGSLIFPMLEPFGSHMEKLIDGQDIPEETKVQLKDIYVFDALYQEKKANARKDSQHDVFRIQGSSKGTVQAYYDLQAFAGIVPGSVRVTSGGTPLRESADYVVDYSGGTLTITNPSHLTAGREIQIDYEQNSLFNVRKKTLLGLRADYTPSQNFQLGATMMSMKEKSPSDKFRVGDEPISNFIWGADASVNFEPRWLTKGIDMIPLLQTREPSRINFSGEFAQLRPNHVETQAFQRTTDRLSSIGRSFSDDEKRGTSFIDDFEGFENTFPLMQPGSWNLAAAPDSIGVVDRTGIIPGVRGDSLRTNWRGGFTWYRINASTLQEIPIVVYNDDPEPIQVLEITDVFPTRDVQGQFGSTLETLDIYMNPAERGQYNYTGDLRGFLDNPKDAWGGMVHRLPEGFTDFSIKNIDFVEFVVRLFPENPGRDAGRSANLYVDLGRISEDVLPDEKLNNEDGLSMSEISESSIGAGDWARLPSSTQNSVIDIDDNTRRTEDLGLDGLASYGGDYPPFATETEHFKAFLDGLDLNDPDPRYRAEVAKAFADPSGDDFHYYGNERYYGDAAFFPTPPVFQQRFSKYFPSYELNGFETQTELAENTTVPRGNSRFPDSEDQNTNSTIDIDNSYFQYELTLSQVALDSLARPDETNDYVVGQITDENGVGNGWYQIRIPVQEFTRQIGSIQDFSQIESIRVWTSGHEVPITLRLASLELVGSQWQESERILAESDGFGGINEEESEKLTISSINNEENADVYIPPIGTVIGETRLPTGEIQESREQSILLRKKKLLPGRQRGIFRTQNTSLDLLKYSNLRMFVHMHGKTLDGQNLASLPKDVGRSKASLFVRLGANESNDYYEYEQPLTPSSETSGDADELWQTNVDYNGEFRDLNSMNIELSALNQLKVARDRLAFPTDSVFYSMVDGIPSAPDVPDAELFAPPGTRLGIKGNPSLGRINSIVIGVRNVADSTSTDFADILEEITVWLNELRVAGYDETNGWAAVGNADIKLADIGSIRASIRSQTDGFGALSSSLDEREQNNIDDWSITSEIQADKLIPSRYNWSMPLSVQYASNTSTPRFSPTRGDVRLDEIVSQINDREDLTDGEKAVAEEEAILAAQTHSTTKSFSARVSKSNSGSGFLRTTLDGIALTYATAATEARTPALQVNNSSRWNSAISYRYQNRGVYTVKPLWLLEKIPFLGPLGRLQFNYVPQSIQTSASFARALADSRDRPVTLAADTSNVPLIVRFPTREKHTFTHSRNFGLQYNPFQFLNLSFDYNTGQSFNQAGVDTLTSVAIGDSVFAGYTIDQAIDAGLIDEEDRANAFEVENLTILPASQVIADAFKGSSEIRTEDNDQRFTASLRPRFTNINALNWIQIQDITYTADFRWKNGPISRNTGAGINNGVSLRAGATVRIQDLFRKFGFYRSIERRQNEYIARKDADAAERTRAKDQRDRAKEQEKQLEAARKAAEDEAGGEESGEEKPVLDEDGEPIKVENDIALPARDPAADASVEVPDTGGGFRLPSIRSWARQLVLAVTGIRDFTINYDGNRTAASTNFGVPVYGLVNDQPTIVNVNTHYSIFDSFKGNGASPAYRFGFKRQLGLEDRVLDPSLQVSDILVDSDKFQAKTTLNPSNVLSITLNWNLDYQNSETFSFRPLFDENDRLSGLDTTITRSGGNSATIWAFGASYLDMFEAQLATYNSDVAASEEGATIIDDADMNGRVALTNASVTRDFQNAFVKAGRTLDAQNLLPFPRPNWGISYSGASNWPLIRALVQNMTIRHSYNATYSADYFTNTQFGGADSVKFIDLGPNQIQFDIEEYQVGAVRVNETYSPLIGLDIGWKKQFSTNMQWTRSNSYSLSTTNFEVSRARTNEFSFTASWQKSGLKLPFFGGKTLTNRVNFSLTLGKSFSDDQRLRLRRGLEEAVTEEDFVPGDALLGDNVSLITSYTRTTVIPKIGYQFSNKVSANFQLKYELFDSQDSRQPSSTVIQGNFNIRVSIAN